MRRFSRSGPPAGRASEEDGARRGFSPIRRVREANRWRTGGLRTDSKPQKRLPPFWTGSRNAPLTEDFRATPTLRLNDMALVGFDDLFQLADSLPAPVPIVAAGGADPTVLDALSQAQQRGWVVPVLTGARREIEKLAADLRIDLAGFRIVNAEGLANHPAENPAENPANAAVAEVRAGRARALMKGQIATPALMKAVLARDSGLRTNRSICQVVLMEIPPTAAVSSWRTPASRSGPRSSRRPISCRVWSRWRRSFARLARPICRGWP